MWQHPAFTDIYARPFSTALNPEGVSVAKEASPIRKQVSSLLSRIKQDTALSKLATSERSQSSSSALGLIQTHGATAASLSAALDFVAGALPADDVTAILREAVQLASSMRHLVSPLPAQSNDASKLCGFVEQIVARIRELSPIVPTADGGGSPASCCAVPVGWTREDGTSHMLLLVISCGGSDGPDGSSGSDRRPRAAGRDGAEFTVHVCNSGSGTEYHAVSTDDETVALRMQLPLCLRGVTREAITSASWWLVVLRPLVWPSAAHGPAALYERLLPHLNGRPVAANVESAAGDEAPDGASGAGDDGAAGGEDGDDFVESWQPPPCAATAAGCGSLVLQALEAIWRGAGVQSRPIGWRLLRVHRALLRALEAALEAQLTEPALPSVSTADEQLLLLALREVTALAARLLVPSKTANAAATSLSAALVTPAARRESFDILDDLLYTSPVYAEATETLELVERLKRAVRAAASRGGRRLPPCVALPPPPAVAGAAQASTQFPMFGWLLRDGAAIEAMAGGERVPPIVRPGTALKALELATSATPTPPLGGVMQQGGGSSDAACRSAHRAPTCACLCSRATPTPRHVCLCVGSTTLFGTGQRRVLHRGRQRAPPLCTAVLNHLPSCAAHPRAASLRSAL